jgi:hypothetical protein
MKSQLDKVIQLLELEGLDISINNQKCTFPTADLYVKSGEVVITANKPSLIRYAIANLLCHELAHIEFIKRLENEGINPFELDHHNESEFQEIERDYLEKVNHLIFLEHD